MEGVIELVGARLAGIGRALCLVRFGSALYGLSTGNSDEDYACVYLPEAREQLLYGYESPPVSFDFATKADEHAKNSADDVDIRFLSLQKLLRGLAATEIAAIDILYSFTNREAILLDGGFEKVFARRKELLNLGSIKPFVDYGLGQIKKYGLKGTSLGIAASILKALDNEELLKKKKLGDIFESHIRPHLPEDKRQFWNVEQIPTAHGREDTLKALRLFDALHPFTITAADFRNRVRGFYNKYGERAKRALENSGIDWKAASHAMRGLLLCKSLLERGDFSYPFSGEDRALLLSVKQGRIPWSEYEKIFLAALSDVEKCECANKSYKPNAAKEVILEFYGL